MASLDTTTVLAADAAPTFAATAAFAATAEVVHKKRTKRYSEAEDDGWVVVDRSRHGCFIDGQKVEGKGTLRPGSTLLVGPYSLRLRPTDEGASPTAAAAPERAYERVEAEGGEVRVERLCLRMCSGPEAGARLALRAARVSIGGPGSQLVVARDGLLAQHAFLRLSHGRVMVEPGNGATFIHSTRVRDITPLWPGEPLRLGHIEVTVEVEAAGPAAPAERFGELRARAPEMQRLIGTLRRMAGHHFTVLVVGESGTGKELIARGVHEASPRARGPYVPLNCGAISPALFESALFGHEKGAFTGADARRDGAFHQAEGGTLFLDEVGELPPTVQAKLLRVLQDRVVVRVGSRRELELDVRVVAATNRDLPTLVAQGEFRLDLYYRLSVLPLRLPTLRERPDDVPILVRHMAHEACLAWRREAVQFSEPAMRLMKSHPWPGNVRQLQSVVMRIVLMAHGSLIDSASVAAQLRAEPDLSLRMPPARPPDPPSAQPSIPAATPAWRPIADDGAQARVELVRPYETIQPSDAERVLDALRRAGGNRSRAAQLLGMTRRQFTYRLEKAQAGDPPK
jgi:Nif-specific regulatory protein